MRNFIRDLAFAVAHPVGNLLADIAMRLNWYWLFDASGNLLSWCDDLYWNPALNRHEWKGL